MCVVEPTPPSKMTADGASTSFQKTVATRDRLRLNLAMTVYKIDYSDVE
jgi:hypothetical protein